MEIDWITVSAQIVNFLVLVGLLERFLYKPVLEAIERRETLFAERLDTAQARERAAVRAEAEHDAARAALDRERQAILATARDEAERVERELLDDARAQAAASRQEWKRQVREERAQFLAELGRRAAELFEGVARQGLAALADAELEERIVHAFIKRLGEVDAASRHELIGDSKEVQVRSAFELEPALRGRLTRAIHAALAEGVEVAYQLAPELICGVELACGGRSLAWSVGAYLEDLREGIEAALGAGDSLVGAER